MQGPDGSVFTGGWNKDVKHGLGRKVYSNGDVYEVRDRAPLCSSALKPTRQPLTAISKQHHRARAVLDGLTCRWLDRAQGLWKGRPNGPGRYRWRTGNEYDGEWRDGKMHGQVRACCAPLFRCSHHLRHKTLEPAYGRAILMPTWHNCCPVDPCAQ